MQSSQQTTLALCFTTGPPTYCMPDSEATSDSWTTRICHEAILQVRLQQYVNRELSDVQGGFRKGRGTRDHIANIHWITKKARKGRGTRDQIANRHLIMEKAREFQKKHLFLLD